MRMMLKGQVPTDVGNDMFKDGSLGAKLNSILADMKPEAVYFMVEDGLRTAFVVFDMEDSVQIPSMVEPWFLSFGGTVTLTPVLSAEDFEKAGSSLGDVVQKYG